MNTTRELREWKIRFKEHTSLAGAKKIIDFLSDTTKPRLEAEKMFYLVGKVYGSPVFQDGSHISTNAVVLLERDPSDPELLLATTASASIYYLATSQQHI